MFCDKIGQKKELSSFLFGCKNSKNLQWSLLNGITVNGIIQLMGYFFWGIQGLFGLSPVSQAMFVSVNNIIRLMESVYLRPKVIPLSSAHCNSQMQVRIVIKLTTYQLKLFLNKIVNLASTKKRRRLWMHSEKSLRK